MILTVVYNILLILILANVIVSWIPSARWHPLGRLVLALSEPLLRPFRRVLPPASFANNVSVDFAPLACVVVLQIVMFVLRRVLHVSL